MTDVETDSCFVDLTPTGFTERLKEVAVITTAPYLHLHPCVVFMLRYIIIHRGVHQ